jgi:K+/H+ antiporter YhaU regulatory subunit KhtT
MSLFGISVMFTTLSEAWAAWYNIADEVEEVQYMEGNRGRGRKRRRITTTVKHFIARAARYKSMANEGDETAQWVELCDTVEKQYTSMLETKSVVNQDLDNVW